jgi:hypothetical protein
MQWLVTSFTVAVIRLASGTIAPENLRTALWYLGCRRSLVFGDTVPEAVATAAADHSKNAYVLWGTIRDLLEQAEADGRVAWRPDDARYHDVRVLNALLQGNVFPPVPGDYPTGMMRHDIPEALRAAGIETLRTLEAA